MPLSREIKTFLFVIQKEGYKF